MASSSDIRDWLREQGRDMPGKGRLRAEDIAAYEAAHAADDDEGSYPDPPPGGAPESESAAGAEQPPSRTRARRRTGRGGLFGRGKAPNTGKARSKAKRVFDRVPVDKLIEHAWADMAWAAGGMPPLSRLLDAQAPIAGTVFEEVVRDTAIDKALQPAARLEAKLDATYGLLAPPVYVLATMATAPEPGAEPSVAHKAALTGLRHSLLVMARVGEGSLAEVERRGRANAERSADVERFMRYLFDIPEPEPGPAAAGADEGPQDQASRATVQAQVLYESAGAAGVP